MTSLPQSGSAVLLTTTKLEIQACGLHSTQGGGRELVSRLFGVLPGDDVLSCATRLHQPTSPRNRPRFSGSGPSQAM